MPRPPVPPARDSDVFALTDKGAAELKASDTSLSPPELELLIRIDAQSTVAELAGGARGLSRAQVDEALGKLRAERLITPATEPDADALQTGYFSIDVPAGFFKSEQKEDAAEVERGVSSLKRSGYYVRIARRPEAAPERKAGWRPTVLVVDDDPDIIKLLATYLRLEGFAGRIARARAEIMTAFRIAPMPDLVLLDVQLPDANGFDVLARMRQHPILKSVPVIMLTAEATRESVLKGLQAGADGYVTKPFEPDDLMSAVKTVLGLKPGKDAKKKG